MLRILYSNVFSLDFKSRFNYINLDIILFNFLVETIFLLIKLLFFKTIFVAKLDIKSNFIKY